MNISSLTGKKWIYQKFDSFEVANITEKYFLSEIVAKLISIRKKKHQRSGSIFRPEN